MNLDGINLNKITQRKTNTVGSHSYMWNLGGEIIEKNEICGYQRQVMGVGEIG